MNRRPAVTLMEVLIAIFIMAIGMMALLVLFPVGAVSMAQALKDDRCAYASSVSENVAIAMNVRYGDACVNWAISSLLNPVVSPTGLAYVDPYGVLAMPTTTPYGVPLGGVIPRVAPAFVYLPPPVPPLLPVVGSLPSLALNDRWFSLQDDISFNQSGTPDTSNTGGTIIDRGRRYSYAYLLRRQPALNLLNKLQNPFSNSMYSVQLYAVVYNGRPTNSLTLETTVTVLPPPPGLVLQQLPNTAGSNVVIVPSGTTLRRGGWILDPVNGNFYRVTNLADFPNPGVPPTVTTVELQQNLTGALPITQITIMDYVAEIFDKGVGWQQ